MNNLKEYLCRNKGMTQATLIRRLKSIYGIEVKKSMMCCYVENKHQPSLYLIKRISKTINIPLENLIL